MQNGHPQPLTILCVDDRASDLEYARCYLEEFGHTVLTATNGEQAVQLARQHEVHGVLLDYRLAGRDGESVVMDLWRANPGLPIIVLSAYTEFIPQRVIAAVDACIDKRTSPLQWIAEIERICREDRALTDPPRLSNKSTS